MKTSILLALLVGFTFSCSTSKVISDNDLTGSFYGVSAGHIPNTSTQYFLELNVNNTFNFRINGHDYRPECAGEWKQKGDTLFLECNEEKNIGIVLSSGYMNQREYAIKVQNKDRLKLDKVALKKK